MFVTVACERQLPQHTAQHQHVNRIPTTWAKVFLCKIINKKRQKLKPIAYKSCLAVTDKRFPYKHNKQASQPCKLNDKLSNKRIDFVAINATYPAMQLQCAVTTSPSSLEITQVFKGVSVDLCEWLTCKLVYTLKEIRSHVDDDLFA